MFDEIFLEEQFDPGKRLWTVSYFGNILYRKTQAIRIGYISVHCRHHYLFNVSIYFG